MKRLVALASTTAMLMLTTLPALADVSQSQKDECLLASKNCMNTVDDIYQRMHRIDKEIKKGSKVYTAAELKNLQGKLQETDRMLKDLLERN